jgi:hypothetical protein
MRIGLLLMSPMFDTSRKTVYRYQYQARGVFGLLGEGATRRREHAEFEW